MDKMAPSANNELIQVFFVVVVSAIAVKTTHAEELLHHFEALDALRALRNHELMCHLESGSVSPSI